MSLARKHIHDTRSSCGQVLVFVAWVLLACQQLPQRKWLNPIETVWARLRFHLGNRERDDLRAGRTLTNQQFKQRVSHLLQTYSMRKQKGALELLPTVASKHAGEVGKMPCQ